MKLYGNSVLVTDGNVEKALRKFKKKVQDSGLLDELRSRENLLPFANVRKVLQKLGIVNVYKHNSFLKNCTNFTE